MLMHSRCSCFHLLMTDDVQVPTPPLLSLYDDLTLMTTTFDAMLTTTVPKIDDPDDNNYEHLWSSGTTYPCHGWDPGSIPGKCTFWLLPAHWLPSSSPFYFDIDQSDYTLSSDVLLSFLCARCWCDHQRLYDCPFSTSFSFTRCRPEHKMLSFDDYPYFHSLHNTTQLCRFFLSITIQSRAVHFPTDRCPDKTFWCVPEMPRLLF